MKIRLFIIFCFWYGLFPLAATATATNSQPKMMSTVTEFRAGIKTNNGTAFTRYSRVLKALHGLPSKPPNGGTVTTNAHKKSGLKIDFSGVGAFYQYLRSLVSKKQPPLPPPPEPPATPRLVLLANNSFDAKCLDGSPPGYYFRPGTGGGKHMWHIYLPHGGWCLTAAQCATRSRTALGSSTFYPDDPTNATLSPNFNGILSSNSTANPPFYNWNLVRLIYCDGAGYSGTAGRLEVHNDTVLYLDGWNIVQAVFEDLKANRGIKSAAQILLSGSSAGGQAVISLCDRIAGALPWAATKCIADSGFFVDSKDSAGGSTWRDTAKSLIALHKPSWLACMDALPDTDHWKCFFPQYTLRSVKTPIFVFHTLFDCTASTLGGLLPRNDSYTYPCLQEVSWTSTGIIKSKEWSRILWKTNYCTAGERDALFVAASVLYDELESTIRSVGSVVAFIPSGMAHVTLCYSTWTKAWIRGTSVESLIVRWLANNVTNRFVHM
ncbi:hypothetical protein CLOP_g7813 [Closterium sp. NIES-67]|nr:hypothetical protein CLOP_g7813 [Closterium sp. NIES-67]